MVDVEGLAQRCLHARADKARGMHYRFDLVGLDGLDDGRQVAHIPAAPADSPVRRASCAGNRHAVPDRGRRSFRRARMANWAKKAPINPAPVTNVGIIYSRVSSPNDVSMGPVRRQKASHNGVPCIG